MADYEVWNVAFNAIQCNTQCTMPMPMRMHRNALQMMWTNLMRENQMQYFYHQLVHVIVHEITPIVNAQTK